MLADTKLASWGGRYPWARVLTAQSKTGNQGLVAVNVLVTEVLEQPAALGNQSHQPAARMDILFVDPEVVGDLFDSLGDYSYLYFCGAGVGFVGLVFLSKSLPSILV